MSEKATGCFPSRLDIPGDLAIRCNLELHSDLASADNLVIRCDLASGHHLEISYNRIPHSPGPPDESAPVLEDLLSATLPTTAQRRYSDSTRSG